MAAWRPPGPARGAELSLPRHVVVAPGSHRKGKTSRTASKDGKNDHAHHQIQHRRCGSCETAGASSDVGDFVSEALGNIMARVRDSASHMGQSIAEESSRFGADALKKVTDEVEHRPLMMLAIAAGIGFLAGLANRR
jgi:ElaB/YqjD/DUF883 family membrane-anchored ribosome-binding protein